MASSIVYFELLYLGPRLVLCRQRRYSVDW